VIHPGRLRSPSALGDLRVVAVLVAVRDRLPLSAYHCWSRLSHCPLPAGRCRPPPDGLVVRTASATCSVPGCRGVTRQPLRRRGQNKFCKSDQALRGKTQSGLIGDIRVEQLGQRGGLVRLVRSCLLLVTDPAPLRASLLFRRVSESRSVSLAHPLAAGAAKSWINGQGRASSDHDPMLQLLGLAWGWAV
jgi:hypothetical protein